MLTSYIANFAEDEYLSYDNISFAAFLAKLENLHGLILHIPG